MRSQLAPVWQTLKPREATMGPDTKRVRRTADWRLVKSEQDVAWLTFDCAGESANTLSEAVMQDLDMLLGEIKTLSPRALVIRSAKPGGFIAGADIRDFTDHAEIDEIEQRMTRAHAIVDRLAALSIPTVAVIHGHCLGGGLELALACRHRFAINGATFAFPEVLLGLHPGLGGTFRLPALIDPLEAMTMMLTGRTVHANKAKKIGLVDAVIEERHVANAIDAVLAGTIKAQQKNWKSGVLGLAPARRLAARKMRSETEAKAPEQRYPAPHRLIDLWERHGDDAKAMQKAEIRSFSRLLAGQTAQNLIRVFFLREQMKSAGKGDSGISHVHVIGAGTMGADIATWCAARGMSVTLADLDSAALARGAGRASKFFNERLHSQITRRDARDRLMPDFAGDGLARADLVIEAIAEDAAIKRRLFQSIAPRMKKTAILATNTSSIPLQKLRNGLSLADRLVGLHFFNPVTRMELVEIVSHDKVSQATLTRANAFCRDIDRLPVAVKSAPGFLVNRVLMPYLMEALVAHDEGIEKDTIDRAAEDFGMPMGPLVLADQVGLDICLAVAGMLKKGLKAPLPETPGWLDEMVARGDTGRKAGRGLYVYDDNGKPRRAGQTAAPDRALTDRLILPMLNMCVACLREGVVKTEEMLDGAVIFGTGFAPFRGGPMHYARERGIADIVARLKELEDVHGPRFAPDPGWKRLGMG